MRVIAIVGGGAAGDEAAHAARRNDPQAKVVLITEERVPLYSARVLAEYVAGEVSREQVFLRKAEDYGRQGIEFLLSERVYDWTPKDSLLDLHGRQIAYDKLILATGSRPFVPPLPGVELQGVVPLKTLADADLIRAAQGKSAVVVGSGPVGIEAVVALRRRGWKVTLIELLDRVLPRIFDAPLAHSLKAHLASQGIDVFLGERVQELIGANNVEGVSTDLRTISADLVVLVLGMNPEVALAKKGGLELGASGGIRVDASLRTGVDGVWACGDCVESTDRVTGRNGLFMLWNNALLQGRVAGANAAGASHEYPGSLNTTTVNLFGRGAASVGILASELPDGEAKVLHRKGPWGEFWLVIRQGRLVGVQALGRTERVGGLLGLLLRGGDLRKALGEAPSHKEAGELWALRGVRRELSRLFET